MQSDKVWVRAFLKWKRGQGSSWISKHDGLTVVTHQNWEEMEGGKPLKQDAHEWASLDFRQKPDGNKFYVAFPIPNSKLTAEERRLTDEYLEARKDELNRKAAEIAAKEEELEELKRQIALLEPAKKEVAEQLKAAGTTLENATNAAARVLEYEKTIIALVHEAIELAKGYEFPRIRGEGLKARLREELDELEKLTARMQAAKKKCQAAA